jgi:transcriptional regulator with XRE-family HTH domain
MNRDPQAWARLGRALKQAREHLGLSQDELAGQADVSTASVQSAEYGKPPKGRMPYTIAKIARTLGWPSGAVDAVLDGEAPPGGWQDIPVLIDSAQVSAIVTDAMIRATNSITSAEIRAVTDIVVREFRKGGWINNEAEKDSNTANP